MIYADYGYHHYGTEIEVPTWYPFLGLTDGTPTIVRAVLNSWTPPLDADLARLSSSSTRDCRGAHRHVRGDHPAEVCTVPRRCLTSRP